MKQQEISFYSKPIFFFDRNWEITTDDDHFLIVQDMDHSIQPRLDLPRINQKRIIKEGIRYFNESLQINRCPAHLVLTETIIYSSLCFNNKTYDRGYLKLVISKDEIGSGFFVIQTVFTEEMSNKSKYSINGIEVEKVRLNKENLDLL